MPSVRGIWRRMDGIEKVTSSSLNQLVRAKEHRLRNRQADLFCRCEVDNELNLHRLLHGKVGRFCSFENLIHISCGTPEQIIKARAVAHKPSVFNIFWPAVNCRKPAFDGEFCELFSLRNVHGTPE